MDIYVDIRGFWKSMYGYAVDSRSRDFERKCNINTKPHEVNFIEIITSFKLPLKYKIKIQIW